MRVFAAIIALALPLSAQHLEPGVGNVHVSISTRSAQAQKLFDQGMAYVYGFNHEAAIRSFQQALEADRDAAMPYWGIAYALGPNINLDVDPEREKQAFDAVQTAIARSKRASAKERAMIAALAKRYSDDPKADLKKLAVNFSNAMGVLHKKYPADLDIATLYAESIMDLTPWRLWTRDGKPAARTKEIVAVLESVLKRNPQHLGANHYYIHAVEASPEPGKALASAKRFATLAPASGHLVHMPAHIYQRTGNYSAAAEANVKAAEVDRKYIDKHGGGGIYPMMYYNHNLQFGSASFATEGRFERAKALADEFGTNARNMAEAMPMVESAAASPLLVLVRFGKWSDVVNAPLASHGPLSKIFTHFARGVAFARLGNLASAADEQTKFAAAQDALTDDPGMLQTSPKILGRVAGGVLEGRIAEARGDRAAALRAYRKAVVAEEETNYNEPADWFYPVRETLGGALLRAGSPSEAEKVFRDDLERNPNNPRSLFGLMKAREAQKKSAEVARKAFRAMWKGDALEVEDL
jgi:tetratricopeptide (TPR) repeat protein